MRGEGDSGTELEKSESEYLIQLSYGNVTTFDMGGRHSEDIHEQDYLHTLDEKLNQCHTNQMQCKTPKLGLFNKSFLHIYNHDLWFITRCEDIFKSC